MHDQFVNSNSGILPYRADKRHDCHVFREPDRLRSPQVLSDYFPAYGIIRCRCQPVRFGYRMIESVLSIGQYLENMFGPITPPISGRDIDNARPTDYRPNTILDHGSPDKHRKRLMPTRHNFHCPSSIIIDDNAPKFLC